jgi:hypothetical protein
MQLRILSLNADTKNIIKMRQFDNFENNSETHILGKLNLYLNEVQVWTYRINHTFTIPLGGECL